MIMVAPEVEPVGQILTPEEYDALPENSRREFVDGVVRMMATPRPRHQKIAFELQVALTRLILDDLQITAAVEIRLSALSRRNPDLIVVRAEGYDPDIPRLLPSQVVLAVEIVSPGSESTDRLLKPIEYAKAGIEHFWRVEMDPGIEVNTFRLSEDGTYEQTGAFGEADTINAPGLAWAQVEVAGLIGKR